MVDQNGILSNRITQIILLIYLCLVPVMSAFLLDIAHSVLFAIIGIGALLLSRLREITRFRLGQLEVELKETIREAEVTMQQMRLISKTAAKALIANMVTQDLIGAELHFSSKYGMIKDIEDALRNLDLPRAEIESATEVFKKYARRGLAGLILSGIIEQRPELDRELKDLIKSANGEPQHPAAFRAFLERHSLLSAERERRVGDYETFLREGVIVHPETWPVGFHPGMSDD